MEIRSWDIRTETHGSNREFTFEQVIDMFRRLIFLGKRERDSQDNLTDFAEYVEDVIAVATLQAKGNNVRA
jgi:ABC-type enterochelin transport system substrate-binding protein